MPLGCFASSGFVPGPEQDACGCRAGLGIAPMEGAQPSTRHRAQQSPSCHYLGTGSPGSPLPMWWSCPQCPAVMAAAGTIHGAATSPCPVSTCPVLTESCCHTHKQDMNPCAEDLAGKTHQLPCGAALTSLTSPNWAIPSSHAQDPISAQPRAVGCWALLMGSSCA